MEEDVKTYKQISKATGIPVPALKAVVKKKVWGHIIVTRVLDQIKQLNHGEKQECTYIMGGPTRKVDRHITEKYNVKFKV